MRSDDQLNEDVRTSELVLADGMSVVWASRLGNRRIPERVAGIDLMHTILASAGERHYRIYLLGAKELVNEAVERKVQADYPGIEIAGRRNGYFSSDDEEHLVQEINDSGADVLFVAISSPEKERFMAQWARELTTPVIHGVGGSFDVYAGIVKRAPRWMRQRGLEWFYRLLQEPRRLIGRYVITNTKFVWLVLADALRRAGRRP
jgi:N-acetylglucosaminyldiphosphoundecaprenol N-acetyl-beta-D-mannosaminyltransferase